jgi:hypothetical protein
VGAGAGLRSSGDQGAGVALVAPGAAVVAPGDAADAAATVNDLTTQVDPVGRDRLALGAVDATGLEVAADVAAQVARLDPPQPLFWVWLIASAAAMLPQRLIVMVAP